MSCFIFELYNFKKLRGKTTEACGELLNLSELKLLATKRLEHTQPIFHEPRSNRGNPKTMTPGPRTPTTDRVRGPPTDRSTDYPYGPLNGPPAK